MKKTTRIIYLVFGIVMPILIGSLHTYVHFRDLVTPQAQELLKESMMISGESQTIYNVWGLMSFMMGGSFIIIGLLNIIIFSKLKKEDYPPVMGFIVMLTYLAFVFYAAGEFNTLKQYYGSIVGMIAMSFALILTLKGRTTEK